MRRNLRNMFHRMALTQQDVRTLWGAVVRPGRGPARRGADAQAQSAEQADRVGAVARSGIWGRRGSRNWKTDVPASPPRLTIHSRSVLAEPRRGRIDAESLQALSDQAVALRRRRLCHPMVALGDSVEYAGCLARPGRSIAESGACWAQDVDIDIIAFDETNTRVRPERIAARSRRRAAAGWSAWSACSRTSFRARVDLARPFRAAGVPVAHRRLPCLRLPGHAAGDAGRPQGGAGARHLAVRRRGGRAGSTTCCATPMQGRLKPLYNYMDDLPGIDGAPTPAPAGRERRAHRGRRDQLRRRARLPVPVLVLHHHQRAGAQVALPHARRRRARSSAPISPRASTASSSPTTISPATRTGRRSSTG